MVNYETIIISDPALSETHIKEVTDKVSQLIQKHQGETIKIDDWGIRKLAYKIRRQQMGHYIYIQYRAGGSAVPDITRTLQLREDVLKSMTVKLKNREQQRGETS